MRVQILAVRPAPAGKYGGRAEVEYRKKMGEVFTHKTLSGSSATYEALTFHPPAFADVVLNKQNIITKITKIPQA